MLFAHNIFIIDCWIGAFLVVVTWPLNSIDFFLMYVAWIAILLFIYELLKSNSNNAIECTAAKSNIKRERRRKYNPASTTQKPIPKPYDKRDDVCRSAQTTSFWRIWSDMLELWIHNKNILMSFQWSFFYLIVSHMTKVRKHACIKHVSGFHSMSYIQMEWMAQRHRIEE